MHGFCLIISSYDSIVCRVSVTTKLKRTLEIVLHEHDAVINVILKLWAVLKKKKNDLSKNCFQSIKISHYTVEMFEKNFVQNVITIDHHFEQLSQFDDIIHTFEPKILSDSLLEL